MGFRKWWKNKYQRYVRILVLEEIPWKFNPWWIQYPVLDVGCGQYKIFDTAIGVDNNPLCNPNYVADAENLPFSNNEFYIVTCLETLEHCKDADRILCEVKRVLRPDGKFILTTPDATFWWNLIWSVWIRTFGKEWKGLHIHSFTKESLIKLLSLYFTVKKVTKVNLFLLVVECEKFG